MCATIHLILPHGNYRRYGMVHLVFSVFGNININKHKVQTLHLLYQKPICCRMINMMNAIEHIDFRQIILLLLVVQSILASEYVE